MSHTSRTIASCDPGVAVALPAARRCPSHRPSRCGLQSRPSCASARTAAWSMRRGDSASTPSPTSGPIRRHRGPGRERGGHARLAGRPWSLRSISRSATCWRSTASADGSPTGGSPMSTIVGSCSLPHPTRSLRWTLLLVRSRCGMPLSSPVWRRSGAAGFGERSSESDPTPRRAAGGQR